MVSLAAAAPKTAADLPQATAVRPDANRQILLLLRLPPAHARANADYADSYGDGAGRNARRKIAKRLAREHGLTMVDDWPMPLVGVDCFILAVPADLSPAAIAQQLSQLPGVEWAEAVATYHANGVPATHNDPLFRVQPAAREWHLADLHRMASGNGVVVAVIDSKIERTHPDLMGQVSVSEDFVVGHPATSSEQHGTGVAGVIAALADNHLGIAGVAPGARLMALRACWQTSDQATTVCDSLSLAKALHYAIDHHAQIINLSLGGPPDILLARLIEVALARGTTVVAAFDASTADAGFPASQAGVIAVSDAVLDPPRPGVYSAPGRDVPTTQPGGRWFFVSGSSFAAAHVSGLYALLRQRHSIDGQTAKLVSLISGGSAVNSCATLLQVYKHCDCGCSATAGTLATLHH